MGEKLEFNKEVQVSKLKTIYDMLKYTEKGVIEGIQKEGFLKVLLRCKEGAINVLLKEAYEYSEYRLFEENISLERFINIIGKLDNIKMKYLELEVVAKYVKEEI